MDLTQLQQSTLTSLEEVGESDSTSITYSVVGRVPRTGAVLVRAEHVFRVDPDGEMRNVT